MATDKEIEAAARAIYDLYWVANKPLWGNAGHKYLREAEAALTAAEQVRANEPEVNRYQVGFVNGYAKAKADFNIVDD